MTVPWSCPVCRAPVTGTPCRRCRADLSQMLALESRRRSLLADASRAFEEGFWTQCRALAVAAYSLRAAADAARLAAVASLMLRDFPAARAWHARLTAPPAPSASEPRMERSGVSGS